MAQGKPVARYHVIEMTLAARIRDGYYNDGGLPGERALAEEFAAARVTIRSALGRLEDQGLVLRSSRRGTLPVSGTVKPRQVLRETFDKFLDRGRRDKRKVLSFGPVAASPSVAEALEIAPGSRVLRIVRSRSDSHGTLTFTEVFVVDSVAPALSRTALERKALVQLLEDHGVKIGTVRQTVACASAPYAVAQALAIPLDAPIMKLTRVVRDDSGAPVEYFLGWYRADRFEVQMDVSRSADAAKIWFEHR